MSYWSGTDKPKYLNSVDAASTNLEAPGWVFTQPSGVKETLVAARSFYTSQIISTNYLLTVATNQVTTIGPTTLLSVRHSTGSPARIIVYDNTLQANGVPVFSQNMNTGEKAVLTTPVKMINGTFVEIYPYNPDIPELVQNGTFNTDVAGWTAQLAGAVIDWVAPGNLRLNSPTGSGRATQAVAGLVIGNTYTFSGSITSVSGTVGSTASFRITTAADGSSTGQVYQSSAINVGGTGVFTTNFVATATTMTVALLSATGLTILMDNVSIKQALPIDGSVELEYNT